MDNNSYNAYLNEIFSHLVLNSDNYSNLGLFHGKMGGVLFFMNYARYVCDEQYENLALDLLNNIYEELNDEFPINLENGLCGIGWGIEYLVQNDFLEGNTDEILKDIDRKVIEYDLSNLSDLSFRKGLGGFVFYIIARLSSHRKTNQLPFDTHYLYTLKKVLVNTSFTEADEIPIDLVETYCNLLDGKVLNSISIPNILKCNNFQVGKNLHALSLGIENGITGFLFRLIRENTLFQMQYVIPKNENKKRTLVLFNEESRASNYGIGTYIKSLIKVFQNTDWNLFVIHLRAYRGKSFFLETIDGVNHCFISNVKKQSIGKLVNGEFVELYYRNVLYLLYPILNQFESPVFQLNYMKMVDLALGLKRMFPSSHIVLTVHYIEWRFHLKGNEKDFYNILNKPLKEKDVEIVKSFQREKMLLGTCDQIVAVSKHSYDDLLNYYQISAEKLNCIPHGIEDTYLKLSNNDLLSIRRKYGYDENEQIIIISGRVNIDKGCEILAKAFADLVDEYPLLRLIVVGDGEYNTVLSHIAPHWSKITLTGYICKQFLYELYSISNIGVIPSFYEEFGYVALEMMMMGIPVVASRTTGLAELVLNEETGITIPLNKTIEENVNRLKCGIKRLLDDPLLCKQYVVNGRNRYLQRYSFNCFNDSYIRLFQNV